MLRWLPLLLLTVACVPKKRYDALQAELDATVSKWEERGTKITDLETALAQEQARAADLDRRVVELNEQLIAANKELDTLRGEKATLLKDKSSLKASIADMTAALEELAARKLAADRRVAEYKDLLARFQKLIDAGQLRVKIVDGRMVVVMATDILFESGKADLSKDGAAALTEVAKVLAEIPTRRFQVEGHTDNVPIKTERFPSNWELASARAIVVVRTLVDGGVAPDRLSAASWSEYRPVAGNTDDAGKASNRRIEIVVVPDLSDLPGFEELTEAGGG